ncbi:mannose-1-phosphate guanylyltransferase [Pelistega indica]|uniref:Mannose-1-phosphate guanylyltransferase n=1 Tax=Pelistega indica TaxID=1414851 RepID=V8G2K7_9BURK|nr:mannose-1-phosphate guanylyltransferase [Pelistega indica]
MIQAMILAAGRGERMRPLTDTLPKPLLEVGGKPLIVWHIERLASAGISDIVINHAWLGYKLPEILGDGSQFNVNIEYSAEGETGLETAGGIANALPLLGSQPFLVINGDIWCDWSPLEAMEKVTHIENHPEKAWLLMVDNPMHNPEGDFHINSFGKVYDEGVPKLTFSGIGVYHPSLFMHIEKGKIAKLAPLLREAMANNSVFGQHYKGKWTDVGTPERLAQLDKELRTLK